MGTILQISDKKLSFLLSNLRIHFPESVHEWTATVFATIHVTYLQTNLGASITIVTPRGNVTLSNQGNTLSDPNNITSGWVPGGPFTVTFATQSQFSGNPNVGFSTSCKVTASSIETGQNFATITGTCTAVTSGRPGGDDEQTATFDGLSAVSIDGLIGPFSTCTVLAAAHAGHVVNASIKASGS